MYLCKYNNGRTCMYSEPALIQAAGATLAPGLELGTSAEASAAGACSRMALPNKYNII